MLLLLLLLQFGRELTNAGCVGKRFHSTSVFLLLLELLLLI
jgi:hypothetical protein